MQSLRQELRSFVVGNFLFGEDGKLKDGDSFLDNGVIDSTGILELVAFLEEKYGLSVEDQDIIPENLDSIDRLVAFVGAKLNLSSVAARQA